MVVAPLSTGGNARQANPKDDEDSLIAQLHEHVEQGRIFDARSIVHTLSAFETKDQTILQLMDEVITESEHVESLLHDMHSDDDWTLAKQKSGVTVHYRREIDSNIHTVRAATTFDNFSPKDFVRFCSLFVETELMHKWFPGGIMKPCKLLSWHSKYSKVIQLSINIGIPLAKQRDAIVLGNGYHLPDRNAFLISTKTIFEDTCKHCEIPKPAKGIVRMSTESIFYVELIKSDVISFKMIGRDDLKLKYMPVSLLNYLSQGHLPFDLMKTVHRRIRNFKGTAWEKMIDERGAYYTEIEDKVYEALEKWEKKEGNGVVNVNTHTHSNSLMSGSITEKNTKTNYFSNSKFSNDVYVADEEDEGHIMRHLLFGLAIIIVPVLYYSPAYQDMLLQRAHTKHILALMIISFVTLMVISSSMLWFHYWKRQQQNLKPDIDDDKAYQDFLSFISSPSYQENTKDDEIPQDEIPRYKIPLCEADEAVSISDLSETTKPTTTSHQSKVSRRKNKIRSAFRRLKTKSNLT